MTVLLDPTSERSPTIRPRLLRPEHLDGLTIAARMDCAVARAVPAIFTWLAPGPWHLWQSIPSGSGNAKTGSAPASSCPAGMDG